MKRQKYVVLEEQEIAVPMQKISQTKLEKTLEAQVQDGDTLQALALRFHCTVAEIKRLNKIDKDNEIYARKIIKVPITPHSILLETGDENIIKSNINVIDDTINDNELNIDKIYEPLQQEFDDVTAIDNNHSINKIILNSRLKHNHYSDDNGDQHAVAEAFLSGTLDERIPQPRMIKGPSASDVFDCSGSDCDMSWICLFIFILALCFAIPLIYVLYVAEHLEKYHHNSL